jgi:hypothetical protein
VCLLDEWFSRLVVGGGVGPSLVSTTLLTHHYQSHNHNHKTHISTHTYQHPAPVRACASVCIELTIRVPPPPVLSPVVPWLVRPVVVIVGAVPVVLPGLALPLLHHTHKDTQAHITRHQPCHGTLDS